MVSLRHLTLAISLILSYGANALTLIPHNHQPARGIVVFCPGTHQKPERYQHALNTLAQHGFAIIGVNIPRFTLKVWTNSTLKILNDLSYPKALQADLHLSHAQLNQLTAYLTHRYLGGQSGGAAIAMRIALSHPELQLTKIFLWNPADPNKFYPHKPFWKQAKHKPPLLITAGTFCKSAPSKQGECLFKHYSRFISHPPTFTSCKKTSCSDCMPYAGIGAATHYLYNYKQIGGKALLISGPWLHTSIQNTIGKLAQAEITSHFLLGKKLFDANEMSSIKPHIRGCSSKILHGPIKKNE